MAAIIINVLLYFFVKTITSDDEDLVVASPDELSDKNLYAYCDNNPIIRADDNGCFWHMHDCPGFVWPKSRLDYWKPKLTRNVERDQQHYKELQNMGWRVIVVWECQLKKKVFDETMAMLIQEITQKSAIEE